MRFGLRFGRKPVPVVKALDSVRPLPWTQRPRPKLKRNKEPQRPFWILSLDGGGVRGVFSATILARIVERYPSLVKEMSLIAGTSTGGLLGLLLASGYSAAECRDVYVEAADEIFGRRSSFIGSIFRPRHSAAPLEAWLSKYLSTRTLGDLEHYMLVTSFCVDGTPSEQALHNKRGDDERRGWRPAVFSNLPFAEGIAAPDDELSCLEAAMRSSAAPTFFPLRNGYADGALFAANPTLVAATKALAHFPTLRRTEIRVLSIGAGAWRQALEDRAGNWGLKQWAPHLLSLLLDSNSLSTELLVSYLLGSSKTVHRIDPVFSDEYIAIDDAKSVPRLIQLAEETDLTATFHFLDQQFAQKGADVEAEPYMRALQDLADAQQAYDDSWCQTSAGWAERYYERNTTPPLVGKPPPTSTDDEQKPPPEKKQDDAVTHEKKQDVLPSYYNV